MTEAAEQVASAAAQVSTSSQVLAQGASEQAASLQETSASGEEVGSMARRNSETCRVAADLVSDSQERCQQSTEALDQMVTAIGNIHTQSGKISRIIKVIDEIAFQTNLLALNAAVEAARAGEAGLGFAVVADEVRNLAARCAQAARDTTDLIAESIALSNTGKTKVDQMTGSLSNLTSQSVKIKSLLDEVNKASEEQARGIQQVSIAVNQMGQVTQQTAASAEEGASASEELYAQSEALKQGVAKIAELVGGRTIQSTRPKALRVAALMASRA